MSYKNNKKKKEVTCIKIISPNEKQVLIDRGILKTGNMEGIYIASRDKKGKNAKTYYAREDLAFLSWLLANTHQDDKDFLKWNKERLEKKHKKHQENT